MSADPTDGGGPEPTADVVVGADGLARCPWPGLEHADYRHYHDHEWGRPVHGDDALYERLSLEAFQSGLSWLTILRKRAAFRSAFADFDPEVVAGYGPAQVQALLGDASIVRNRRKIEATIAGARATLALRESGGLEALVWSARPARQTRPRRLAEVPAHTAESAALARALKKAGFAHLGPTTVYAAMQAVGVVQD
nr:DNA-3-methyladenine glycosylase I [Actinomycetota bacterium]